MKRINNISEIDWLLPISNVFFTYILPMGVLVGIRRYSGREEDLYDVRVTNANYEGADFHNKSFGNNYTKKSWFEPHLQYWVERSSIWDNKEIEIEKVETN